MTATARTEGDTLVLSGRITADNVVSLRHQGESWLASLPPACAAVTDLSAVTTTSSVLLSLLLCWQRAAGCHGVELQFAGAPEALVELSRLNGVSRWLTGCP